MSDETLPVRNPEFDEDWKTNIAARKIMAVDRAMESPEEKAERAAREKRKARLIARANWELAEKRFARWMPKVVSP